MLIFPLKKEWYEKIKSGEKTIEYREVKPYWTKRLLKVGIWAKPVDNETASLIKPKPCKLRLGYTNRSMMAMITKVFTVDGKDTDLAIDKPVYAIHLADVREVENA